MNAHGRTRLIFKVHSYTGLITGIAMLLFGITGSILVFSREFDDMIYRDFREVQPIGTRISLDSGLVLVKQTFPEMNYITYDGLPQDERAAFQFFMMDEEIKFKAYLDPYTSEILHYGKKYDYWMDWLLLFHYTFTIPVWGEFAAAILSLTLLVSITTGAIVYRKYLFKVILFRVAFKGRNWRTTSSSLHRIVGVWSLVFHVIIAVSALWLLRGAFTAEHFSQQETAVIDAPNVGFSIDEALRKIEDRYPEFHPRFLTLPESDGIPAYFYGYTDGISFFYADYYDEIAVDGDSIAARFHDEKSSMEKLNAMMYPVHAGVYGSLPVKIVYAVGGLTPALLSLTGFLLWWRRKR